MSNRNASTEELLAQALEKIRTQENYIAKLESDLAKKQSTESKVVTNQHILKKASTDDEIDWKKAELAIGKYWIQIIGIITFLAGMAFLLKYSIEQGWVTPAVRVIMSFCTATSLVIGAELWRKKFGGDERNGNSWANGLLAGGIILYYFTFYIAFNNYRLIGIGSALFAFSAVTLLSAIISIRRNSTLLAAMTLCGGYLTPLILGAIKAEYSHMIFGYLTILALAFLVISYTREWFWLSITSVLCIAFITLTHTASIFTLNQLLAFSMVMGIIYFITPYLVVLVKKLPDRYFEALIIPLCWVFLLFSLDNSLSGAREPGDIGYTLTNFITSMFEHNAIFTFLLISFGLIFLIQYAFLYLKNRQNRYLLPVLSALCTVNIGYAIISHFGVSQAVVYVNLFGLLLLTLGFIVSAFHLRVCAYVALYSGLIHGVLFHSGQDINFRLLTLGCGFLIATGIVYFLKNKKIDVSPLSIIALAEERMFLCLTGTVIMIPFYWFHTKIWAFPYDIFGIMIYALLLFIAGIFVHRLMKFFAYTFLVVGCIHFAFAYFSKKMLLNQAYFFDLNILYGLFLSISLIVHMLTSACKQRFSGKESVLLLQTTSFFGVLLALTWCWTNVVINYLNNFNLDDSQFLSYAAERCIDTSLVGLYGLYALAIILVGLWRKKEVHRYLGLALLAFSMLKLLSIMVGIDNSILKFTSFIVMGVLLVLISIGYQRLSKRLSETNTTDVP